MSQFSSEIRAQPDALRALVEYYRGEGAEALAAARAQCAGEQRPVLFTGMGSSFYASLTVRARLAVAGRRVELTEAGELLHYEVESRAPESILVAVSQSGESAETRQVAEALSEQGGVVAVTNEPDSALARCADVVLPLRAGEEVAVSTKTYTNTLALLHLLATAVTSGALEPELVRLEQVAALMEDTLERRAEEMEAVAAYLEGAGFLYFVARGPALAAAHQGALTFTEGARLPTCALAGGAFRHGPLELAGPGFAGLFFAPEGRARHLTAAAAREVAQAGGRVLLLTTVAEAPAEGLLVIALPDVGEELFSLNACVPVELLLYHVARERGLEAGVFEHISKVTRRE